MTEQTIRVNFSDQEANSEARDFDPVPRGKYHVKVTDYEMRESKSEKNYGKPYWNLELTIQDGPYENRKLWTNVMLFDGALYTLAQIMKALGLRPGKDDVPSGEELISKDFIVNVIIKPANDEYDARNEVKGFKAYEGEETGSNSLLP